jgi:hypothetical protein
VLHRIVEGRMVQITAGQRTMGQFLGRVEHSKTVTLKRGYAAVEVMRQREREAVAW